MDTDCSKVPTSVGLKPDDIVTIDEDGSREEAPTTVKLKPDTNVSPRGVVSKEEVPTSVGLKPDDIVTIDEDGSREEAPKTPPRDVVSKKGAHKLVGFKPGLIFGAFFGLLLVTSALTFNSKEDRFNKRSHNLFFACEGLLALLQIILMLHALKKLKDHEKSDFEMCSEDSLLLIGYAGTLAFHLLTLSSVVKVIVQNSVDEKVSEVASALAIPHLLLLIASHALQTAVIAISRRYRPSREEMTNATSVGALRQCILFMLTTNLSFWALDSFVEMKDGANSSYPTGEMAFGDDWGTIVAVTYPLVVFFRFHSAEMLYAFWSRFR